MTKLNSKAPWFVTIALALAGTLERIDHIRQETELARIRVEREFEQEKARLESERIGEKWC